jgi:hypothetical protein
VTSHRTAAFREQFARLPGRIQRQSRKAYRLWESNPQHPSLDFKLVGRHTPSYSVRIAIGWRALGYKHGDTVIWFWIGTHAEYDKLLRHL